jgi:DNA-binding NarL/FixJ family response regulator
MPHCRVPDTAPNPWLGLPLYPFKNNDLCHSPHRLKKETPELITVLQTDRLAVPYGQPYHLIRSKIMIRIMVVSELPEERARLNSILAQWPDFDVSGPGGDSYNALYSARSFKPDLVLLDEEPSLLGCPGMVSALKRWSPHTKVIILVRSPANQAVLKSIGNGAAGYLLKNEDTDIIPAILWAYRGGVLMSPEIALRAFNNPSGGKSAFQKHRLKITGMELELLTHIGRGLSDKEIAAELRLKDGTIRNHISVLLQKTGLRNRTEMAVYVHHTGILGDRGKLTPRFPALFPTENKE